MTLSPREQIQVSSYLYLVGIVILYFDYAVTFTTEVTNVWKRPRTAILFFCNRYFTLIVNIPIVALEFQYVSQERCHGAGIAKEIMLVVSEVLVCVLLAMRTFALFGGDRRIIWLAICAGVALLGASAFAVFVGREPPPPELIFGCSTWSSKKDAAITSIPWIGLTIWDIIIFALTYLKTRAAMKDSRAMGPDGNRLPIRTLMLRDGALYFVVMGAANIASILTFFAAPPFLRGCLIPFANNVSVIMMNRLMLNIYDNARPAEEWELSPRSVITQQIPRFTVPTYSTKDHGFRAKKRRTET